MNRRKRTIGIALVLLLVPPAWITYREWKQATLDHALIEAIKAGDDGRTLKALADGANGEARESDKPSSFWEALLHLLDRFRYAGATSSGPSRSAERTPALLLLYQHASNTLPYAGSGPDLRVVRALLEHGAQVNDREAHGASPLSYASCFSNGDTVRLLLAYGADTEAKDEYEDTPLMMTDAENTRILLEHGANIEARDLEAMTPLMWTAKQGRTDVLRILLQQGANTEAKAKNARTPLIFAARTRHVDIVRLLLEQGAKVSPKDETGATALDYVRHDNSPEARKIAALLRQHGAQ